jgi:SAM-dependent methyltransferase
MGALRRMSELAALYRFHSGDMDEHIAGLLRSMQVHQTGIERRLGMPLRDKVILEIGPGQLLKQARFFGAHNRVIAVDLDEVITAWDLVAWWRMLRTNGPVRFFKTLVRKIIGVDRRFVAGLKRQMPAAAMPDIEVLQRDAASTGLKDGSVDCAMSFSVLEHVAEPGLIMREIVRVLRPGGVSYHIVHNFSSDTGAHDARSFLADHGGLPYWCHLRTGKQHLVASNSFVNRLSLEEWKNIARNEFPGVEIQGITQYNAPDLVEQLAKLRAAGELAEYTDEELMTVCLRLVWTKPAPARH